MSITDLDYSLFQSINGLAGQYPLLDTIMRFLSKDAEYFFYLGVIVYWFTRKHENRRMVATALVSACLAFGIGMVISHSFYRDRPFVAHSVHQLIDHAVNASFPSDHAIGAFVIAASIWMFRKKDGTLWLLLAACIAFSRVWNGVHYPFDVIAGALIGIGSTAAVYLAFAKSGLLQRWLTAGIGAYEQAEHRIWPKRGI